MESLVKISDRFVKEKAERLQRLDLQPIEYFSFRRCSIKLLIVTDYGGSFDNANFGLSAFLEAFNEPLPYTSFNVTKAHRRTDANADVENFKFDNHDLSQYDVIFLFGIERPAFRPPQGANLVDEPELKAISEYMNNGGGVFATGDHEDLGVDMCGRIPRIRSMRRWYTAANPGSLGEPFAPAQSGGGEHNTVVDTNLAVPGLQGNQSDMVPQTISLNYYYRFVTTGYSPRFIYRYIKYPHPVLCSPDGVINKLPDHMHEGLCEVPSDLTRSFTFDGYTIEEYPMVGGTNLKPEVIAQADNHTADTEFGVIAALDGHRHATIGRVLVDATWHHFFNINIRQFQNLKELVDRGGYTPNAQEVDALKAYNLIQHYYRNIAYWLAPKQKQSCFRTRGLIWLLNHHTIKMSFISLQENLTKLNRFQYFHMLGVLAKDALGDIQSVCQSLAFIPILDFILPERRFSPIVREEQFSFVDPEVFETVSLGTTLHNLHQVFLENSGDVGDEQINAIVEESTFTATEELLDNISSSIFTLKERLKKRE